MSENLKKCEACNETFSWDDEVILVNDEVYHKDCVQLYPTGYFAIINRGDTHANIKKNHQG